MNTRQTSCIVLVVVFAPAVRSYAEDRVSESSAKERVGALLRQLKDEDTLDNAKKIEEKLIGIGDAATVPLFESIFTADASSFVGGTAEAASLALETGLPQDW